MDFNLESAFFSMLVLVGGIFTIAGMVMYIFPPKRINYIYGYRTSSSMKSEERWNFAQRFSAIAMIQSGLALVAFSIIGLFYSFSKSTEVIAAVILIILALSYLFIRTENGLKKFR